MIEYLLEQNRVLKAQVKERRLRLTDDQRRRLAAKGRRLGRRVLRQVATIVTPDTILRWHRQLIAQGGRETKTLKPIGHQRNRRVEIPKDDGRKVRVLGVPAIRDRVVQGALKLVLEPIFEADSCDASYGYHPKRKAYDAVARVTMAILAGKTQVIDLDLAGYFDTVRYDLLLGKVARRVQDAEILHLLKWMLTASGKSGVPRGGVISPLLSNIYLTEVDAVLERAKAVTQNGSHLYVEYARYADDLAILVNGQWRPGWLLRAVDRRLREELAKLDLRVNETKSRSWT